MRSVMSRFAVAAIAAMVLAAPLTGQEVVAAAQRQVPALAVARAAVAPVAAGLPATLVLYPSIALQYEPVKVVGRISGAKAGREVLVQTKRGKVWVTQVRARTDAAGRFTATVFRAETGDFSYRVVAPVPGKPPARAAVSFPATLRVVATTVFTTLYGVAVPGVTWQVPVTARPTRPGREVTLQVREGDTWTEVARGRTGKTGTVVLTVRTPTAASVTYRATAAPYGRSPGALGVPGTLTLLPTARFTAPWTQADTGLGTCAIDGAGRAFCWGPNDYGQLGNGSNKTTMQPLAIDGTGLLDGKRVTKVSMGRGAACALDDAGAAYCWGIAVWGVAGNGRPAPESSGGVPYWPRPVPVDLNGALAGKRLVDISVGYNHACALDDAGAAYCWGLNDNGQLGNGLSGSSAVTYDALTSPTPVPVATEQRFTRIAAGSDTTCAISRAAVAWCWGRQPGTGLKAIAATPVPVDASGALKGRRLVDVSAGTTNCLVDSDGRGYCWGSRGSGELGDGAFHASLSPVGVSTTAMPPGTRLVHISGGDGPMAAVDTVGRLWMWGQVPRAVSPTSPIALPMKADIGILKGKRLTDVAGDSTLVAKDDRGRLYEIFPGAAPMAAPDPFPVDR